MAFARIEPLPLSIQDDVFVVVGGTVVGILTEADFVRFVAASGDALQRPPAM